MEWIPAVFIAFKVSVLGIGMFLAIRWHYRKAKEQNGPASQRAFLWATGKVFVVFALLLVAVLFLACSLASMLGIDLTLP